LACHINVTIVAISGTKSPNVNWMRFLRERRQRSPRYRHTCRGYPYALDNGSAVQAEPAAAWLWSSAEARRPSYLSVCLCLSR